MKKIVLGVLCLFLGLSLFYFLKDDSKPVTVQTGAELLGGDSEIWFYQLDNGYVEKGVLTYNFNYYSSNDQWFIQGVLDINEDNSFSYDEWLVRNKKVTVVATKGSQIEMRFDVPEDLKETDLSEMKVWIAATRSEIGLLPDIFEQDGFVIKSPILYKSQESN